MATEIAVVTGAFGNTGAAISRRLLAAGTSVRTLTDHPPENGDTGAIAVHPLTFDDSDRLTAAFDGASTFYNTYWVRRGLSSGYDELVDRSAALIAAASAAGVRRIVQISVIGADVDAAYPYFRAKGRVEQLVRAAPPSAAIIRPSLLFGGADQLLNDLAWVLRQAPLFAIAGDGRYRVRPIHVDDLADLCVAAGAADEDQLIDAIGPERPTFDELVRAVRDAVGARTWIFHAPPWLVLSAARVIGRLLGRELLTADELASTIEGIADIDGEATGSSSLAAWIADHGDRLGRRR